MGDVFARETHLNTYGIQTSQMTIDCRKIFEQKHYEIRKIYWIPDISKNVLDLQGTIRTELKSN